MKKILRLWCISQKKLPGFFSTIFFVCIVQITFSQFNYDSLDKYWKTNNTGGMKMSLKENMTDSLRLDLLRYIAITYSETNIDSSLQYGKLVYFLSKKNKWINDEAWSLDFMGAMYLRTGNATTALQLCLEALRKFETIKDSSFRTINYKNIGDAFNSQKDPKAFDYYFKSLKMAMPTSDGDMFKSWTLIAVGAAYFQRNMFDSANYYAKQAYQLYQTLLKIEGINLKYYSDCLNLLGSIQQKSGNVNGALEYFRTAVKQAYATSNFNSVSQNYMSIALLYKENKSEDSSLIYAMKAYTIADQLNNPYIIVQISSFLKQYYKDKKRPDSAFKYGEILLSTKDNLFNLEKTRQVQNIAFGEQVRQQEIIAQQVQYRNKVITYAVLTIAILLLGVVFILWRNNSHKQQLNTILQEQKEEIQSTLTELKSAQAQLIQSEKMASLGELTAGIAHEIQNPLNFVNNFSEVSNELIDEMNVELDKGDISEAKIIATDIKQNLEKINHHGKRADAIVKGMLQHSQSSGGKKEPTDINKLADEYLRLSYHGLRAKDNSFNTTLIPIAIGTDFDETIGNINIIPQDIGRVLLNLYNNAFYAVMQKQKGLPAQQSYAPKVTVVTKRLNDRSDSYRIEIKVTDNGNGIPQKVVDKIFQPFFTTKPTGQGTGLGLSLSYDIVKTHGGEIKVESKEDEGSEFIIQLPIV